MLTKHNLLLKDVEFKFAGAESQTFEGYGSVFGNVDSYMDIIEPGAYKSVIAAGGMPKMFFNHKMSSLPLGKWTHMEEDSKGLLMRGELTPGNTEAQNVRAAMKHGTVDGLSIGYMLAKSDYTYKSDVRHIKNISLLAEVSIVAFPANEEARLDLASVKSDVNAIKTISEFEGYLREAGGLSKGVATALVSRFRDIVKQGEPDAGDAEIKVYAAIAKRLDGLVKS